MKSTFPLAFAIAVSVALSACAPLAPLAEGESAREEKDYITGSQLPQRRGASKVASMSKEDAEEMKRNAASISIVPTSKN